ncbi:ribonuclease P protein component [Alkalibacter rhizosphaerae]|uniref:Ribonuclease P protein component n=1 Tax=Alkalibacter rhizosphaerae TaxID=2815577 RepID=A0A975AGI6_9FIRM|nr:ribonuclease P protein component [Alkalibacter rhizosphaerae]QSX07579.1 ribonuclease P protein component [Alkalibacter rhizosphaerae]
MKPNSFNNRRFRVIYGKGASTANRNLVLYYLENGSDHHRLGITVSKKIGNSVTRNRVRRWIKESYRLNPLQREKGLDLVFIARKGCENLDYHTIEGSVKHLLRKIR